ncbi:hypothetical protein HOH87_04025 [bacterium]|nr:hypothetical protein [bacterium]
MPTVENESLWPTFDECEGCSNDVTEFLIEMYLSHRFDLLGSGWVRNAYDSTCLGLEGSRYESLLEISSFDPKGEWLSGLLRPAHVGRSMESWALINDQNYKPIDWQRDFKSGYRWSQRDWYKDLAIIRMPGVDIKVPWELARLQHLPRMALLVQKRPQFQESVIREFRSEVLDFIATNPPRMGVNWVCTMDVSIRVSNILLSYYLLRPIDRKGILDDDFRQALFSSVFDHGDFIFSNLERVPLPANHYLSNLVGLLFVASSGTSSEYDKWFQFASKELISEMPGQFYEDGSNFEASTFYHRLSAEMMTYGFALLKGHNVSIPEECFSRLYKAGELSQRLTRPGDVVAQIGDNDSGRFFKLTSTGQFLTAESAEDKYRNLSGYTDYIERLGGSASEKYWDENELSHGPFLGALAGLDNQKGLSDATLSFSWEKMLVEGICRRRLFCD